MLRRYSSRGVETLHLESRRTIGKQNCDILVEGNGVASPHAAIELHPFMRTYWLRELSLTGTTTVNGRQINGQTELHSGDLIRLGNAQPLVFEEGSIFPARKISSEMSNKSYEPHLGILPVLGQRVEPQQTFYRTLNGSRNSSAQRSSRPKRSSQTSNFRDRRLHTTAVTPNSYDSSPASIDSNSELSPRLPTNGGLGSAASVGNSLLQRVVRLQSEVSRKDEEILSLLHRLRTFEDQFPRNEKKVQEPVKRPSPSILTPLTFELEAYRSFIHIICQKLHKFNEIVLSYPHRDYADVFLKFSRSLEEPFSVKMTEIEEECRKQLHEKSFTEMQLSRLRTFLTDDHKEQISNLAHELEVIFPVIRDATSIARESISVCSVFTQWSRQLGDNLRSQGLKSSLLHHAIDSLKEQFAQSEMSRHWLPPSVAPLFRLIALEAEKKESGREREAEGSERGTAEGKHDRVGRSVESQTFPNKIDDLIMKAEEKTVQLQGDIDSLSDSMRHQLDLDRATEAHLESLCTVLATIKDSLQRFTEEHDRTYRKRSILSVEVNQEDLEEGMLRHQASLSQVSTDEKTGGNTEETPGSDFAMWEEAFEGLRAKIFHLLGVELRAPSTTVEYVVVRKQMLEDLIYAAINMYEKLKEAEEAKINEEETLRGPETVPVETLEQSHSLEATAGESHEESGQRHGDEDGSQADTQKDTETGRVEEWGYVGSTEQPSGRSLDLGQAGEYTGEPVQKHAVVESSGLDHTVDNKEEPHPEERVQQNESVPNPRKNISQEDDQTRKSMGQEEANEEGEPRPDTPKTKREASADDDVYLIETVQKLSTVGEKDEPQTAENSPRTSVSSLGVISSEEYIKHGEGIISPKTEHVPVITKEGPSLIERQTSQLGSGLSVLRPKSARPRSSYEPNGTVVKKIPPALSLDQKSEAFEIPSHPLDKGEWSSQGTDEEINLSETPGPTPILDRTMTLEERQLFEARKRASLGLADSLLNCAKPKSICEVTYNAHIQSHINTASRTPNSYSKVPVSAFDFFNSPPAQKKKGRIEEKPPLRQPRMQFKF